MCGIVGYIGTREAYPILISGLHRLEYRGYDSAGVALIDNNQLNVYKAKGKVSELEKVAQDKDIDGTIGIAHTRWATHGQPNATNAHPHVSMSGDLAIVHNGIIENYIELKQQLVDKGYDFKSETDTEVLVQLIDYSYRKTNNLTDAVSSALNKVIGAYAIAVIDRNHPETLVAARKSSPLVVGVGENNEEFFIGSDASPIVEYTDKVIYLDDEQIASITIGQNINIIDLNNHTVAYDIKQLDLDIAQLTKGGFPHFMLKEIYDQPECIRNCVRGRLIVDSEHPEHNHIVLSALSNFKAQLIHARHVIIVACGTSWHAGLIGKQLIEKMCRIRVEVEYASEFRYREPVIEKDDLIIAISQSGETADTLAAIQLAKEQGALIFGIVNGVGSSIAREADTGIYIHVGPEIGVASTKAFTGQVMVLSMLSIALGQALGTVSDEEYSKLIAELDTIPSKMQKVLEQNDKIEKLSGIYTYAKNFLYLGRGYNYPVALEGALKLKEISYIHAEGYPAAEMKHGPIALVDENMPIVFIATHHQLYQKIISNMKEVKARNGRILAVVTEGDKDVREIADEVIEIPQTIAPFAPLLSVLPLQLLSYHVAIKKGQNVDMPRNLAKSVTVE